MPAELFPATEAEAVAMLAEHPGARPLAGGGTSAWRAFPACAGWRACPMAASALVR